MTKINNRCLGDYKSFLLEFIKASYQFISFNEFSSSKGQLMLRHDIDYDVELAYQGALIEHELGVKSTYFFLIRSNFYNPFSKEVFDRINDIKELGHSISIHFDPTIYEDFHLGFKLERKFFEDLFNVEIGIISLHRPNDFFQKFNQPIGGVLHTYQQRFFKDVKYFADSTGIWRFGSPLDSEEFRNGESIHLLIHPIWWFIEGENNLSVLRNFYRSRLIENKAYFESNSIPFRQISNEF
jgi:hypothetical protein